MQTKHCTLGWDSIGSYLEWGSLPSAHNGDANRAAKYGKKAGRVKYVCTGKSPACQISLLYHYSLFPLLLLHRQLLMLLWSAIHALPIEPKLSKKNSFPLIEFKYHHILKSGSHRMLSDAGAEWEQAKWKGWHVSLSLPRRIHVLACFCSLATLHNR